MASFRLYVVDKYSGTYFYMLTFSWFELISSKAYYSLSPRQFFSSLFIAWVILRMHALQITQNRTTDVKQKIIP